MAEQHDQILTTLGLPADQIAALNAITPDQMKDFNADTFITPISQGMRTALLADNEFLKTIDVTKLPEEVRKPLEQGQYGRFINEYKSFLKEQGLDITDLPDKEQNSLKALAKAGFDKHGKKIGAPEALQTLQTQLQAAIAEKEGLQTDWEKKHTEGISSVEAAANARVERMAAFVEVGGFKTVVPASMIADSIQTNLKAIYSITFNTETTSFEVKQKANPQLPVMEGSKVLTYKDVLTKYMKDNNLLAAEKVEEVTKKVIPADGNGQTRQIAGHIAKKIEAQSK